MDKNLPEQRMRVSFDLDEVLFVSPETHKTEPPPPFPFNRIFVERLRLGAPDLIRKLQALGYEVWVYTSSYRTERYIKGLFRLYGSAADSFSYSVIIGNLLTPLIDTYIVEKPFAYRKNALRGLDPDSRKPRYKRIPKPVIALTVIAAIAGVALSGVYSMTKDTIEAQKEAAKLESYKVVAARADSFRAIEKAEEMISGSHENGVYGSGFGRVKINAVYEAVDEAGNPIGTVMSITSSDGFDGDVTIALGLDADGKVTGIAFTELHETPGMGMRADEESFKGQFVGQDSVLTLVKGEAKNDGEIAAITGASITSTAVANAVSAGIHFYQNVIKGAN